MSTRTATLCVISGLVLGLTATSVHADTPGLAPFGGGISNNTGNGNDGLLFTPNTNIDVTALGYFFSEGMTNRDVGIFRVSDGALMGSTLVLSSGTIVDGFVYTSVTSFTLLSGVQYAIVGVSIAGEAQYVTGAANVTPTAHMSYDGYLYNNNAFLSMVDIPYSDAYIGANFQYVVPAPGAAALLGIGGLAAMRRRR